MPLYFFHLAQPLPIQDTEGEVFGSNEDASAHAVAVAGDLARNHTPGEVAGKAISVTDEEGTQIATVPLREQAIRFN